MENQVIDNIEQTIDPQGQSEFVQETAEQSIIDQSISEAKSEDTESQIPKKFIGKSMDEVLKSYAELEKEIGRTRAELGEKNKKLESLSTIPQQSVQQPVAENDIKTFEQQLMAEYDRDWREDPKQAIPNLLTKVERVKEYQNNYTQQMQLAQAAAQGQVPGMEDFAELQPTMVQLVQEFGPLINPSLDTHPKALQAVYLMAKGLALTDKLNKTQSQLKTAKKSEKLEAYSESPSTSQGSDSVDFSSLSLEEMKKFLGVVDRSVEG